MNPKDHPSGGAQTLTDEFVEHFSKPQNRRGVAWRVILRGELPEGVEGGDPRVIELIASGAKRDRRLTIHKAEPAAEGRCCFCRDDASGPVTVVMGRANGGGLVARFCDACLRELAAAAT